MTIDRFDRTVVAQGFSAGVGTDAEARARPQYVGLGLAAGLVRTVVTVVLALLAILVLLPAAIAAQAASSI